MSQDELDPIEGEVPNEGEEGEVDLPEIPGEEEDGM